MAYRVGRVGQLVRRIAEKEITDTSQPLVSACLGILAATLDGIDEGEPPAITLTVDTLESLLNGEVGEIMREVARALREDREE
jgi:hypothetical protein